ncbi:MAG: peptidoglycan DD-metalloendopeptidase family protein [Kiloniellales bacterium]
MKAARGLALALAGIGMTVLAGCVGNSGSGTFSETAGTAGTSDVYTVMAGDTLWGISRSYGVSLQSLIDANTTIPAPYVLQVGQQVRIPSAAPPGSAVAANTAAPITSANYAVQPGDTLYAISRRSGIPVSTLADSNGLIAPYDLQVGQQLTLPAGARDPDLLAQARAPIPTARAPLPATTAVVASGTASAGQPADLLGSLESSPSTTAAAASAAGAPVDLTQSDPQVGEVAVVEETASVETVGADGEVVAVASAQAAVLEIPAGKPARDVALPAIAAQPPPPTNAALPTPPKRQGRLFDWPVTGKVISSHGPKKGGLHNDGINIAAPAGTPVRAAESGVVAYTGGDLKGFGKLVLIKHQDGYVTAYAHNSQILVQRGETVRRGDVIARVGETGNVDTPQLHFEIRKDAKPVDPSGLMVGVAG